MSKILQSQMDKPSRYYSGLNFCIQKSIVIKGTVYLTNFKGYLFMD